jgi:beta-mannanase
MANACSGGTVLKGLSGDCSGVSDVTLNNMITTGAAANANWNSLLDQFVGGLQDLQNSGMVVILRPFHKINGNWFWWSGAGEHTKKALFRYVQNYFNNVKGLHNILWEYCIVDDPGTLVGYPGDEFVDLMATDVYFQVSGPTGGYTRLATHNKPIAFAENNCRGTAAVCFNSYNWDNQLQDAKANML